MKKLPIEHWIRRKGASPVTRQPLAVEDLYHDGTLADLMEEEKGKMEYLMHPTFREWKNEPRPYAKQPIRRGKMNIALTLKQYWTIKESEKSHFVSGLWPYFRRHMYDMSFLVEQL